MKQTREFVASAVEPKKKNERSGRTLLAGIYWQGRRPGYNILEQGAVKHLVALCKSAVTEVRAAGGKPENSYLNPPTA